MEVLRPNTLIGPLGGQYVIKDLIGTGGMGQVYRARVAILTNYEVAIKTLNPNLAADPQYSERFLNEARAASTVKHPHVVDIKRYFVHDGKPYIVMDYLKGMSLDALLRQSALEVTRAIDIILSVCSAVYFCHRHKIYHRDLKPANVYLVETEDALLDHVVVLDFGVAKIASEPGVTRAGSLMGTPSFLAPEALVETPANPVSDQYSLAVLLYYSLTRKLPFRAPSELELWRAIRSGVYTPPRTLRPEIPEGIERAIARAMSLDPAARFDNVHMFGRALLPFGSPAGQQHWSSLFTAIPRPIKIPALSAAITIPPGQPLDQTIVDLLPLTRDVYGSPTVISPSPVKSQIQPTPTVSDRPNAPTTPTLKPPASSPSPSQLVEIVPVLPANDTNAQASFEEPSSEFPGPTSRIRRFLNPLILTGVGAVAGISIVLVAIALARAPHARSSTSKPPFSDLTAPATTAVVAPVMPVSPPRPPDPHSPPGSPIAAPSALPATTAAPAHAAADAPVPSPSPPPPSFIPPALVVHKSHRPRHVLRDEHGIPIIQ